MNTSPRRQPIRALLALACAALACIVGTDTGASTPEANLATVTPGGRISVSLLTPTLILDSASVQSGTLIGSVATATAAAATAIAATATAHVPTPTIPGVFVAPAQCPAAGNPTLPVQPPPFSRYPETIAQYLSGGGATTILEARLRGWGAIVDYGGVVLVDRDFTGDSVPEVLVVALDPQHAEFPYPGDLYIFGCDQGAYRLLYQAGYAPDRGFPILRAAQDINGDYLNDLVYAVQTCTGTICTTNVKLLEWNLTLGNFENLFAGDLHEISAQVDVQDVDGDKLDEVVVTSGTAAVPEAGPLRVRTTTLHWDGTQYVVASVVAAPAQYRIHVIQDGDAALKAADYQGAVNFYQQAVNNDSLLSWRYPDEAQYLKAYATYRIMLAYAAMGNVDAAQNARDLVVGTYAPPPVEGQPQPGLLPGSAFAEMARLFWNDFAINRSVGTACQVVIGYARAAPGSYEVLNSFGTANPVYTPADLCPFN